MTNRYNAWAVTLAACLEVGIIYLYYAGYLSTATAISCGFSVGAVLVAALMLGPAARADSEAREDSDPSF